MAEPESHDRLYAYMKFDRDQLISWLNDFFGMDDTYAFYLMRHKSAFAVGTVSLEDFEEFNEETIAGLADHVLAKLKSDD